jgi:RimJ/RimL family protein N-acetyltransferase
MLRLEFLNFEDKELLNKLLVWRNDPDTRSNSNNTNIISQDIFKIILNKYKESSIHPLIAFDNDSPIGILTFVESNNKIYIGINIDPFKRGNSYGSKILEYFSLNYKQYIKTTTTIYAEVKKTNLPSIKLFSKYFSLNTSIELINIYTKNFDI